MLQGFWWDSYDDTKWATLTSRADELSQYFDLIWIPNAGTTAGGKYNEMHNQSGYPNDMGYMPCMWLEYNTCFGTEEELRTMIATYKAKGTGIIEDVVVNHKNGYEGWWWFYPESKTVDGQTYTLTWDNETWTGICRNDEANYNSNSGIAGRLDNNDYDTGDGFDGCRDLNHVNTQVQQNIITYQDYLLNVMGFAGFRLDMVKGYNPYYTGIYNSATNPTFSVGEFWDANKESVKWWIDGTGKTSAAFDFPLKYTMNEAISNGNYAALSDKSFTADPAYSRYSVTFAENHDTFRPESCPLEHNWSAANAFILAMPGTPCIFYKHYQTDPTNIRAMIMARKACGITNQTQIKEQYSVDNNSGYVIVTEGKTGTVRVHLGSAANQETPYGYILVASGDSYKFYRNYVDVSSDFSAEPSDGKYTVYFDNAGSYWGRVCAYVWDEKGNPRASWPGSDMELTPEGYYKYTFESKYNHIIFTNGSGVQTGDLIPYNNRLYNYVSTTGDVIVGDGDNALLFTGYSNKAGRNAVVKSDGQYACSNLVLSDNAEFTTPYGFQSATASYSRLMANEWGTIVVPFSICYSRDNGNYKLYQLTATSSDALTFTEFKDGADIAAGTPMAVKAVGEKNNETNRYELVLTARHTTVSPAITASAEVGGLTLTGTYGLADISDVNGYIISNNQFWNIQEIKGANNVYCAPFRAYIANSSSAQASTLRIVFGSEEGTGIENVDASDDLNSGESTFYDVSGRRTDCLHQGVNIVKRGNKTLKVIIK